MLPDGRPPMDSSNAPIPLLIFAIFFSLRLLMPVLVLSVRVPVRVPLLVSCFVGCLFHLNPLFHYPCPLGYWDVTCHVFFGARVTAGFGAFSRCCCVGACRGRHFELR